MVRCSRASHEIDIIAKRKKFSHEEGSLPPTRHRKNADVTVTAARKKREKGTISMPGKACFAH